MLAELKFDIPKMYKFHKDKSRDVEVDFIRVSPVEGTLPKFTISPQQQLKDREEEQDDSEAGRRRDRRGHKHRRGGRGRPDTRRGQGRGKGKR